jgi:hypothetical protein
MSLGVQRREIEPRREAMDVFEVGRHQRIVTEVGARSRVAGTPWASGKETRNA